MLKKSILFYVSAFLIGANVAMGATPTFNWNNQDQKSIDESITFYQTDKSLKPEQILRKTSQLLVMKQLIGKDAANTSYADFKKIVNDTAKSNKDEKYLEVAVPQFVLCVSRFKGFVNDVIADSDYKNISYTKIYLVPLYQGSDADWRKLVIENIGSFNYNGLTNVIKQYEKRMINFSDEEVKADLKKFKKVVYPKININEQWKQLAVKIELMIKANE